MMSMLVELSLASCDDVIDSAAEKSFISQRGWTKMRQVELRDLLIQREVGECKVRNVILTQLTWGRSSCQHLSWHRSWRCSTLICSSSVACTGSPSDGGPSARGRCRTVLVQTCRSVMTPMRCLVGEAQSPPAMTRMWSVRTMAGMLPWFRVNVTARAYPWL